MLSKHIQLIASDSVIPIPKDSQDMYVINNVPILTFLFKNTLFTVQLDSSDQQREYYNVTLDPQKKLIFYFQIIKVSEKHIFKGQGININKFNNVIIGHRGSGADEMNSKIINRKKAFPKYTRYGVKMQKDVPFSYFSENTVQAIQNGLDKIDGVEFDVQVTNDDKLIINHNFYIDKIEIQSHSFEDLGCPTLLSDILDAAVERQKKKQNNGIKYLDIELKYNQQSKNPVSRRRFLDLFYAEIEQYDLTGYKIFITSFDPILCHLIKLETNLAAFYINIGSIIYFKQPKETNFNQLAQRNIFDGLNYACKHHIDGIVTSKYMLMLFPTLKREIKHMGLKLIVWGNELSYGIKGNQVVDGVV